MTVHEPSLPEEWELVVGLEVHVELATKTKLFCGCENKFSHIPNTLTCPTCVGLPGSLPVMNEKAVEFAMRLGRALGCEIHPSVMARKNYFYPDMAKDFQTTQYDQPTNADGRLALADGTVVGIERAHIEEDAGKTTHVGGGGRINDATYSLVDYNRAGVPLVEIVSRPDIRTPEQARQYVNELRAILVEIGASDARMEEGSMRVDANVSVRRPGEEFGTRCEIKNVNSVRSLGRAIDYEARRQVALISDGEVIQQETRHWDEGDGRTHTLRTKEDADDYRYFPDPDLVPLDPGDEWINTVRSQLPMLPAARRVRLAEVTGQAVDSEAIATVVERRQDDYVVAVAEIGGGAERVLVHVKEAFSEQGSEPSVPAADLAALVAMEVGGELTSTQTKTLLGDLVEQGGGDPKAMAAARGFEAMDTSELDGFVDDAIAADPDAWSKFCAGDGKAMGALVGHVMKASRGQADGKAVTAILNSRKG